jgi:hypothetical protein
VTSQPCSNLPSVLQIIKVPKNPCSCRQRWWQPLVDNLAKIGGYFMACPYFKFCLNLSSVVQCYWHSFLLLCDILVINLVQPCEALSDEGKTLY